MYPFFKELTLIGLYSHISALPALPAGPLIVTSRLSISVQPLCRFYPICCRESGNEKVMFCFAHLSFYLKQV